MYPGMSPPTGGILEDTWRTDRAWHLEAALFKGLCHSHLPSMGLAPAWCPNDLGEVLGFCPPHADCPPGREAPSGEGYCLENRPWLQFISCNPVIGTAVLESKELLGSWLGL